VNFPTKGVLTQRPDSHSQKIKKLTRWGKESEEDSGEHDTGKILSDVSTGEEGGIDGVVSNGDRQKFEKAGKDAVVLENKGDKAARVGRGMK